LPIPNFEEPKQIEQIINISGRLAASDKRFATWAKAVGVPISSVKNAEEKLDLSAQLEALVARGFGLSEDNIEHIFRTFHAGWDYQDTLDKVIEHFREGR
jgi:hypothetical protein